MKKQHYRLPECFLLVTPSPAGVTTILPSNNINVFPVFAWVATGIPWHASLSLSEVEKHLLLFLIRVPLIKIHVSLVALVFAITP